MERWVPLHIKKKYIFAIILLIILSTVVITVFISIKPRNITYEYNKVFPKISIYSVSGAKKHLSDTKGKNKVIFYLSDSCEQCIKRLENIKNIMKVFNSRDFTYVLVWDNDIPVKRIQKAGIDMNLNYTIRNKVVLYESKPAGFILDKDNRLVLETFSFDTLITRIWIIDGAKRLNGQVTKLIEQEDPYKGKPCNTCK